MSAEEALTMAVFPRRPGPRTAETILRSVFGRVETPFGFRLWDGSEVRFRQEEPRVTVVIHAPETFVALIRDPSPGHFAEAYVSGQIDLEGDLFAAMEVADEIEGFKISVGQRFQILACLVGGRE